MDKPKILIIDDDPQILEAVKKLIQKQYPANDSIYCTSSAEDAQVIAKQHHDLALVLVDYSLPQGVSLSFLQWLSRTQPACVRVVISGFIDLETILPEIQKGLVHRFFSKPWDNKLLLAQIQECILQHSQLLQATTDPITQIGNYLYFQNQLKTEIERSARHSRNFSIAMIDIDHFKKINDVIGHPNANQLLFQIAQTIKNSLRSIDHAFRFGGDEFAVILPDTQAKDAFEVLERLRRKISDLKLPRPSIEVSVSIGLANFPEHGTKADMLVSKADHALYEAKHRGRNQTVIAPN